MRRLLTAIILSGAIACGGPTVETETVRSAPVLVTNAPPPPGQARPFSLPEIRSETLDNGLQVYLVDRPGFPTVSVRLSIDGGTTAFPDDLALGDSLVRLLRSGTESWSADEISNHIDGNGIRYGTGVNDEFARLDAAALANKLPLILELLGGLVSEPTFPDDRVAAKVAEFSGEASLSRARPEFHTERAVRRALAPADHPYARYAPEPEDYLAVTGERVRAAWRERVGPQMARLVVVGDLPDDALAQVSSAFSAWERGDAEAAVAQPIELDPCNIAHVVVRPNSAQTSIVWLGDGHSKLAEDFFPALLANQVVGGGPSARLFMNLREDKSYTYGAYSRMDHWRAMNVLRVSSNVRGEVTADALTEFEYEFDRYGQDELTSDLEDGRAYLSGVFPIQLETNDAIAGRIASLLDDGVPLSHLTDYREAVGAVSEEAARAAGEELFDRRDMTLVMVGEEENVVPAAVAHASTVHVYDLDGQLIETLEGELASTCE